MKEKFYITTPIYYPSGKFHIGTAYTEILADTTKRYKNLKGFEAYLLTGLDEHGQKIENLAKEKGITPQQHVDEMAKAAISLWQKMDIQYDDFIRTTENRHVKVVQEIFEKDIRRRVIIKNRESFETIRQYLVNNFGSTTSVTNLQRDLEKNGQKISRQTLTKYIRALVDAKVLYACDRFDMKSRKSIAGEKKYYLSDLSFYFALNTDNRINYGPVLENIVYLYARSMDSKVSVGRIGKLECDFIMRDTAMNYAYVQVAYTIAMSKETEDREYKPLEMIRDNYPKYVVTTDYLLQKRNGIQHVNLIDFMKAEKVF